MNTRVNGFRAGVMAALMVIGGAGCKKAHYVPMPKENISPKMEQVVNSLASEGSKIQNDSTYIWLCNDTIRLKDKYIKNPNTLKKYFAYLESLYNSPSDIDDVSYLFRHPREYYVTSNQIFVDKHNRACIAISAYENTNRKNQ